MAWGDQLVDELRAKGDPRVVRPSRAPAVAASETPKPKMNKTETRMAGILEARARSGEIRAWFFEHVKLNLADRCWYTPDFMLFHLDNSVEFIETKGGFIREDGWLKLKMAARLYPTWRFTLAQYKKGAWTLAPVKA